MELLNRYIAAVQRELPSTMQEEVGRDIRHHLLDELEARTQGKDSPEMLVDLLQQWGPPSALAQRYAPKKPLIAEAFTQQYKMTLTAILVVLLIAQIVVTTLGWLETSMNPLRWLITLALSYMEPACIAFTVVTLSFMAASSDALISNTSERNAAWSPNDLPPVTLLKISGDEIITNLVTYTFLLVVIVFPYIGHGVEGQHAGVTLTASARHILTWSSALFMAGFLFTLLQLYVGYWTAKLQATNIALNVGFIVVLVTLLLSGDVFELTSADPAANDWHTMLIDGVHRGLWFVLLFPAYELVRDARRLVANR